MKQSIQHTLKQSMCSCEAPMYLIGGRSSYPIKLIFNGE